MSMCLELKENDENLIVLHCTLWISFIPCHKQISFYYFCCCFFVYSISVVVAIVFENGFCVLATTRTWQAYSIFFILLCAFSYTLDSFLTPFSVLLFLAPPDIFCLYVAFIWLLFFPSPSILPLLASRPFLLVIFFASTSNSLVAPFFSLPPPFSQFTLVKLVLFAPFVSNNSIWVKSIVSRAHTQQKQSSHPEYNMFEGIIFEQIKRVRKRTEGDNSKGATSTARSGKRCHDERTIKFSW